MRVVLTESTARAVARRIEACTGEQAALARRFGALPLYGDIGGWVLLRRDGEFISMDHDTDEVSSLDDEWACVALVLGARRYPELACLVPARPADAADCAACGGTGQLSVSERFRLPCATCRMLGWVAPRAAGG